MHTFDSIVHDLKKLGVREGDTYLLRVSYKAIGKIEGGPKVFLDALLSVIGLEGTIILTAFPQKHMTQLRYFAKKYVCSKDHFPKPATGVMPVMALTYPKAKLSEKLEFPFVVIGKHANYLTENHTHDKAAYWLLREAMDKFDCKCLRIGGNPHFGSTHMALEDVFRSKGEYMTKIRYGIYIKEDGKERWYDEQNITFCGEAYSKLADRITKASVLHEGMIGDGCAIITSMKKSYDEEVRIYTDDIHLLLCDDPNCMVCRTSYSFSDSNNMSFLIRQIKRLFSRQYKEAVVAIKDIVLKILFARNSYW